ncbi:xylose isomerase [Rhodovastum atsumiense]|uniref:Xylose isomerase n=1 Tax=Rhodovastum atsumiense TaxID=504468 RepID=A0A5M6IQN1_9PROT|nr:xylose isomerase [Rhodovastum atsumiense]KAA5610593.1 xylose isomerase [Rhodovastum atsumiense]CAH2600709.1 xylose isomerase [Rhodovastum atsumiense]
MSAPFFGDLTPLRYEGPETDNPLAYRWYNPDQVVLGKRMEEHLRFAACYWHSFCYAGSDPFGAATLERPWFGGDAMDAARRKADAAFALFDILGVPFFTFHDRDIAPEGGNFGESLRNVRSIAELLARKMEQSKVRLLWGTANLFSHPRYMAGAASNPDPDVFAYAAATVKNCMDVTRELGGQNYVLWGGREGYETLLNTDLRQELDQLGRFLNLVVEYKHRTGFTGTILIEPKPKEPTKHQYDFDVASIYGFLCRYGLEREVKVNIEANHATLAGHSYEHEIALANALGIFGSLDVNRGDPLLGWDTDQFPNNVPDMALAVYHVLQGGGFTTGGMNFDAKIRRQSLAAEDLVAAHVGGIDTCARALLAAARMIEDGKLAGAVQQRYAGWQNPAAQAMLAGKESLEAIADRVAQGGIEPRPVSGRQEQLENLVNRYV